MKEEVRQILVETADRCECAAFIEGDPVQFPHRYTDRRDIEVSAFIADAAGGPYRYVTTDAWRNQDAVGCLYRFYKWEDFSMLCARMADVYSRMESLEDLFIPGEPLEKGVLNLCREFEGVNGIPVPGSSSANKRLYMFLRWMVRKGSPVDFGIWTRVTPAQLLVPVDTHVYATAKALGLTSRSSADLKTSIEITGQMVQIWPDDPARGDFALYGSQVM